LAWLKHKKHNPFTQNISLKRTQNTCNLSQGSQVHHYQCSVPQVELTVRFMSTRVNICVRLRTLAVCNWAHMPIVFVMIKFTRPHYV